MTRYRPLTKREQCIISDFRRLAEKSGATTRKLAELTGLSATTVHKIRAGKMAPSTSILSALAYYNYVASGELGNNLATDYKMMLASEETRAGEGDENELQQIKKRVTQLETTLATALETIRVIEKTIVNLRQQSMKVDDKHKSSSTFINQAGTDKRGKMSVSVDGQEYQIVQRMQNGKLRWVWPIPGKRKIKYIGDDPSKAAAKIKAYLNE